MLKRLLVALVVLLTGVFVMEAQAQDVTLPNGDSYSVETVQWLIEKGTLTGEMLSVQEDLTAVAWGFVVCFINELDSRDGATEPTEEGHGPFCLSPLEDEDDRLRASLAELEARMEALADNQPPEGTEHATKETLLPSSWP